MNVPWKSPVQFAPSPGLTECMRQRANIGASYLIEIHCVNHFDPFREGSRRCEAGFPFLGCDMEVKGAKGKTIG
jgi:hypothetical protein